MHELRGKRIAVLRGAGTHSHFASLSTGKEVIDALIALGALPVDVVLDQNGDALLKGRAVSASDIASSADGFWDATHGHNPVWNDFFATLDIPKFSSALLSQPKLWKEHLRASGYSTPRHLDWSDEDENVSTRKIVNTIVPPWIVKSSAGKQYLALTYVELTDILRTLKEAKQSAVVEEHINGREFVVSMVENFRGKTHYDVPVLEISVGADGEERFVSPRDLTQEDKTTLSRVVKNITDELSLKDFATVRLIVTPRSMYVADILSRPPHHSGSAFRAGLEHVGASLEEFIASRFTRS